MGGIHPGRKGKAVVHWPAVGQGHGPFLADDERGSHEVIYNGDGKPLAIVECKRPDVTIDGTVAEQALRYSAVQNVKYIFLTNGKDTYIFERKDSGFEPMQHFPDYTEMSKQCLR